MCPVYFVNDVTGLHPIFTFPFKGKAGMGMGSPGGRRRGWSPFSGSATRRFRQEK
jgi:hypothetical protein